MEHGLAKRAHRLVLNGHRLQCLPMACTLLLPFMEGRYIATEYVQPAIFYIIFANFAFLIGVTMILHLALWVWSVDIPIRSSERRRLAAHCLFSRRKICRGSGVGTGHIYQCGMYRTDFLSAVY
jgi:hypothetical protein